MYSELSEKELMGRGFRRYKEDIFYYLRDMRVDVYKFRYVKVVNDREVRIYRRVMICTLSRFEREFGEIRE